MRGSKRAFPGATAAMLMLWTISAPAAMRAATVIGNYRPPLTRVFALVALSLASMQGAPAADYDVCMEYCIPEKGFAICNGLPRYCASAGGYTYGACMEYCVPEKGFSICNGLPRYCASARGYTYGACMEYCVPEKGFAICNGLPRYCASAP